MPDTRKGKKSGPDLGRVVLAILGLEAREASTLLVVEDTVTVPQRELLERLVQELTIASSLVLGTAVVQTREEKKTDIERKERKRMIDE